MSDAQGIGPTSAAQRAEVERLAAEGVSVRRVAAQVFGDARYRGRVERIVAGGKRRQQPLVQRARSPEEIEAALREFEQLSPTGQMRWLFERHAQALAVRERPPSATELNALLRVLRQLEAREAVERLQAGHREQRERGRSQTAMGSLLQDLADRLSG